MDKMRYAYLYAILVGDEFAPAPEVHRDYVAEKLWFAFRCKEEWQLIQGLDNQRKLVYERRMKEE